MPDSLLKGYRELKWILKWRLFNDSTERRVCRKMNQGPIKVLFLSILDTNWKYDALYKAFAADAMFDPIILVCPIMDQTEEYMVEKMSSCYNMLKSRGYNVVKGYDKEHDRYVDIEDIKPDLVFNTEPYKGITDSRYFYERFKNMALICYINYSYEIIPYAWAFTNPMQNHAWRFFLETEEHLKLLQQVSPIRGKNCVVTGYPMYDTFMNCRPKGLEWKDQTHKLKRIIWAPHQSIEEEVDTKNVAVRFSTFLLYAQKMRDIAVKYKDQIEIAFKPHPVLKMKLYKHPDWGKEKTDEYYEFWKQSSNTSFVSGDYVDLFCSSDALMHDCGSFTAEYLYTQKPALYLANYVNEESGALNIVGINAFRAHYQAYEENDIENFVKNVIIDGNDTMQDVRKKYFQKYLMPQNGVSVSENIIHEIKKVLLK